MRGRPASEPEQPHDCSICHEPLQRRDGESVVEFNRRLTCGRGRACMYEQIARRRRVTPVPHDCTICGRPVIRRDGESGRPYNERPTCGQRECRYAQAAATNRAKGGFVTERNYPGSPYGS